MMRRELLTKISVALIGEKPSYYKGYPIADTLGNEGKKMLKK